MANKPLRTIKFPGLPDTYTIDSGLSEAAKQALLSCFRHVAWTDEHGQEYYNALASALYSETYPKIVADFNSGVNVIYTDDELNTLKQYLTVKHYANAGDSGTTIPANNYTLSGVLTAGTSTIIATYNDLTTAFTINDVVDFYNQHAFSYPSSGLERRIGHSSFDSQQRLSTNSNIATRCILGVKKGRTSYYGTAENEYINLYPFPVPNDATSITLSYDVGDVWCGVNILNFDGNTYSLSQDLGAFGYGGGGTKDLPEGQNRFATFVFGRPNNATFEGTNLPQSVSITFE